MSEKTEHEQELTREEAADRLQELARELREGEQIAPRIGNKTIELSPTTTIDYKIEVEERSPMLGGKHETITVVLDWEVDNEE